MRSTVGSKMRSAYHADSALAAEAALTALAAELDKTHPSAAASVREGLADTLTVLRLGVPPTLARTLRSTNAVESMISICRDHSANVKRWRDGQMALRWCAAGMTEAGKQFRRVNGHLHLKTLRSALERHVGTENLGPETLSPSAPPDQQRADVEVPRNSGQPPIAEVGIITVPDTDQQPRRITRSPASAVRRGEAGHGGIGRVGSGRVGSGTRVTACPSRVRWAKASAPAAAPSGRAEGSMPSTATGTRWPATSTITVAAGSPFLAHSADPLPQRPRTRAGGRCGSVRGAPLTGGHARRGIAHG